jgi:hypothetical protein
MSQVWPGSVAPGEQRGAVRDVTACGVQQWPPALEGDAAAVWKVDARVRSLPRLAARAVPCCDVQVLWDNERDGGV